MDGNIAKGTTDPRVQFISQVFTQILFKFSRVQELPIIGLESDIKMPKLLIFNVFTPFSRG